MLVSFQFSQKRTPSESASGHDAAYELDQARAHQIPDALGVGHDARDQHAGLGRIKVGDGQPGHVLFHAAAHLGNRSLGGDAENERQEESGRGLDQRGGTGGQRQRPEQVRAMLANDLVDQNLGGCRQHEAAQPADGHEQEAKPEAATALPHELAGLAPRNAERWSLLLG